MERNMRKCPKCGRDSYVTDSRLTEKGLLAINFANEIEEMKK